MRFMNYVCAAAIAVAAVSVSSAAFAQRRGNGPDIVVVNVQRIANESVLGRDMNTKLQAVGTAIQHDAQGMEAEGQSIQAESERLQASLHALTAEQLRSNAQVQALAQRTQQYQQHRQALEGDMQCSSLMAQNDFMRQLTPVMQTIATQHGASVVLSSSAAAWTSPDADITNAVIQQLDASARTSNAARHPVSECQPQQAAPAAGQ